MTHVAGRGLGGHASQTQLTNGVDYLGIWLTAREVDRYSD